MPSVQVPSAHGQVSHIHSDVAQHESSTSALDSSRCGSAVLDSLKESAYDEHANVMMKDIRVIAVYSISIVFSHYDSAYSTEC